MAEGDRPPRLHRKRACESAIICLCIQALQERGKKMKTTKAARAGKRAMHSALLASAAGILLSVVMLAGATFAWFTDSVTSSGNTIQAGILGIMATAAPVDTAQDTFTILGNDTTPPLNGGKPFGFGSAADIEQTGPIIGEANWEPGRTNAKLLTVTNTGTLAARIKLDFDIELDTGLESALWFDFIRVGPNNEIAGTYERREISTLEAVAAAAEITLGPANADGSGPADPAQPNSVSFILAYGMAEEAGNDAQGKEFRAAVHVLATQAPQEQDGFGGDQYDVNASYPVLVSDAAGLETALQNGGSIQLTQNVAASNALTSGEDVVLDLNGCTLTIDDGKGSLKAGLGTHLTIQGSGIINGTVYTESKWGSNGSSLTILVGEEFSIHSQSGTAINGTGGSHIRIEGGKYSAAAEEGTGVIHTVGAELSVENAEITVGAASVMNAYGIYSNASATLLENVKVDANYSRAVYLNNELGNAVIRGGEFATTQISDPGFLNPTIQYKGTLDISGAKITRVANGILYSKPLANAVDRLTCSACEFVQAGDVAGSYKDIDYKR